MSGLNLEPIHTVLSTHNLDAVALIPGPNFRRTFGADFHLMERPLVVIIPAEGVPAAIVPDLEVNSFLQIGLDGEVINWLDQTGYADAFRQAGDVLGHLNSGKRIGLEGQRMRVFEQMALADAFPQARFVDAHAEISTIRLVKASEEIADIRKAIQISEDALEATLQQVEVGQSETEIQSILIKEMFGRGADGLGFDPIVAAGDNSALPHATSRSDYRIKPGDALLIDFGAGYRGYSADITRTFFVAKVSDDDRAFYETVQAANEAGKAATKPGVSAHDIDDEVQRVLERSQFAEFTLHKTGHGLGLDVHEAPQIMRGNHEELAEGMVFTVEPGLYRQGEMGVRIEDDVLVTSDGVDCLTSFPRDLRIVG